MDLLRQSDRSGSQPQSHERTGSANMALIISALGMADKYGIDELADRCMTIINYRARSHASCWLDTDMILSMYEETGPLCKARRYAARIIAIVATRPYVSKPKSSAGTAVFTAHTISEACSRNKDPLDDFFKAVKDRPLAVVTVFSICEYHLHPNATVCLYSGMDGVPAERRAPLR